MIKIGTRVKYVGGLIDEVDFGEWSGDGREVGMVGEVVGVEEDVYEILLDERPDHSQCVHISRFIVLAD